MLRANGSKIVGYYMLCPFAHLVACCCAKFETGQTLSYVQTDATTPNIVGPTMLGVVGPTMLRPFAWGFRSQNSKWPPTKKIHAH